jgi:hypothetical protein
MPQKRPLPITQHVIERKRVRDGYKHGSVRKRAHSSPFLPTEEIKFEPITRHLLPKDTHRYRVIVPTNTFYR